MIEIPVALPARGYNVTIGRGSARLLPALVPRPAGRLVVVSTPRVWSLHAAAVERPLRKLGRLERVLVPDGERAKTRAGLARLHDAFLAAGLPRDGLVVAFGGGAACDLAGFAAATWLRGVDWAVLPTTLLAMVDSSIGGKVAVNHPLGKNLIGAFHQPRAVVIDPSFLATLPARERQSGAYEVLKCAVLADRALFESLQAAPGGFGGLGPIELENAIASACRIKAEVVEKDERESGLRRVLNLGHTLGHALEAATGFRRFTHGEAVGWGLVGAAWIACRRGLLSEADCDAICAAVDHLGSRPRVSDLAPQRVLDAVGRDKKARAGRVGFVLPTAIGAVVERTDVGAAEIRRALRVMAAREARFG